MLYIYYVRIIVVVVCCMWCVCVCVCIHIYVCMIMYKKWSRSKSRANLCLELFDIFYAIQIAIAAVASVLLAVCVCAWVIVSVCMHASVCECVWKCRHIYVVVVAISAAFVAVAAKLSDFFCSFSDTAVMLLSSWASLLLLLSLAWFLQGECILVSYQYIWNYTTILEKQYRYCVWFLTIQHPYWVHLISV